MKKLGINPGGRVQQYVDTECLKFMTPLVPKDTNALIESAALNSIIGSGEIRYRTPYARRWYYIPADFQEGSGEGMQTVGRGNYWFERMKRDHKEQILAGAKKVAKG